MIRIHRYFHEILGENQKPIELLFILLFAVLSTIFSFIHYYDFLNELPLLNQVILLLLTLDIAGGDIANLTYGTDLFYSKRKKARIIFIIIHIQPILIFLFANQPVWIGLIIWLYTIFCAIILELLKKHPSQKVFAIFTFFIGLFILLLFQSVLTAFVNFLIFLYLFKVLYSFSVNHYH